MNEVITYEDRLDADPRWAMDQGDRHFARDSDVWRSLRRLARCLDDLGIQYAVIGALAMYYHGHRRFTIDIDLIVRTGDLALIHAQHDDLDCIRPDPTRRSVRDRATGVRIDFHVTGTWPGDGRPQPVSFPNPVAFEPAADGIAYVDLATLLQLELASGMTGGAHRLKDLADAVALIKSCKLPADFANRLDPFVQPRYREMWPELQKPDWHEQG